MPGGKEHGHPLLPCAFHFSFPSLCFLDVLCVSVVKILLAGRRPWKRVRVHSRAPLLWHLQDVGKNRQMHTSREGLRLLYVPITMARTCQE